MEPLKTTMRLQLHLIQLIAILWLAPCTFAPDVEYYPENYEYPAQNYEYPVSDAPREVTIRKRKSTTNPPTTPDTAPYPYNHPNLPYNPYQQPLTPSKYIQDFVESVFRGGRDPDKKLDPYLKKADEFGANPGFQGYWSGGQWALTEAQADQCNSTADCNEAYKKFGELCATNMEDEHDTFENYCDLNDDNCRDGTAQTWTEGPLNPDYRTWKWYRVSKQPIYINILSKNEWYIILSDKKGRLPYQSVWNRGYVFTYGVKDQDWDNMGVNCIQLKRGVDEVNRVKWGAVISMRLVFGNLDWYMLRLDDEMLIAKIEYKGSGAYVTGPWSEVQFTLLKGGGREENRVIHHYNPYFGFDFKWIGLASNLHTFYNYSNRRYETVKFPVYWELKGWLPIYSGKCRGEPPTLLMENPQFMTDKVHLELYNMAERLDEFGFNFTRIKHG